MLLISVKEKFTKDFPFCFIWLELIMSLRLTASKGDLGKRIFGKGEWDNHDGIGTILVHSLGLGSSPFQVWEFRQPERKWVMTVQ